MRRRRLASISRAAGALALAVLVCAWLLGRVVSDRYAWSQPISWLPPAAFAVPVWIATLVGLLRLPARRERARRNHFAPASRSTPSPALGLLVAFSLLAAGHLAFIELGLHRLGRSAPEGEPVRLVFWNQAGQFVDDPGAIVRPHRPTLVVLANRHSDTDRDSLAASLAEPPPGTPQGAEPDIVRGWPFDLLSRVPVRRWSSTSLGLEGRSRVADGTTGPDPGWAAWFEVDAASGPLVLWAVDLPSDPDLARFPLARRAGEAIASWEGSVRVIDAEGSRSVRTGAVGFPTPDIIVGDFNIPRGSASLGAFLRSAGVPGMRNAFDAGGAGWERTWPRERPVWAIDHCFVGERVGVSSLATPDPGVGGHRAMVVGLRLR